MPTVANLSRNGRPTSPECALDNNIASRLLGLLDRDQPARRSELSEETRFVCGIAAYLTYSGIEIVPDVAHYEHRRDHGTLRMAEDDRRLHTIDHLEPQIFADLHAGRTATIPEAALRRARSAIDSIFTETEYDSVEQPGVKLAYTHLLYAWVLCKEETEAEQRLERYLNWSFENSLSSKPLTLYVAMFLSDQRPRERPPAKSRWLRVTAGSRIGRPFGRRLLSYTTLKSSSGSGGF